MLNMKKFEKKIIFFYLIFWDIKISIICVHGNIGAGKTTLI